MTDYRSDLVKAYDEANNTPQSVIDAHNAGVDFFYWMTDNGIDADEAKAQAAYDTRDTSEEGVAYWTGFGVTLLEAIQNRAEMEALPRVLHNLTGEERDDS